MLCHYDIKIVYKSYLSIAFQLLHGVMELFVSVGVEEVKFRYWLRNCLHNDIALDNVYTTILP